MPSLLCVLVTFISFFHLTTVVVNLWLIYVAWLLKFAIQAAWVLVHIHNIDICYHWHEKNFFIEWVLECIFEDVCLFHQILGPCISQYLYRMMICCYCCIAKYELVSLNWGFLSQGWPLPSGRWWWWLRRKFLWQPFAGKDIQWIKHCKHR